jgi:hypothetical protein
MFFTQEDYRKIEAYLKSKAVRDTSFDSATTPLQGNETIVLVQGGKNVNTTVSDIVSQFFALGVSDFINVTDKYGISYNTLDEAIRVIPWRSRKVGQVITFLNEQGEWHLYQYQGESILTWNNTTLWVDLLESRIVNSILPDQEDLTMTEPDADGNSYMHFKDKDYSIDDFSGLGRVYLRKNLQTLTDPNTGETRLINYLTQTMVGKENVIYHIQYDYNLNGQTIIIPEGCVLLFEGGSISNGTINFSNTFLTGDIKIKTNLLGTVKNNSLNVLWFNVTGDGNTDDRKAIQDIFNIAASNTTVLFPKVQDYYKVVIGTGTGSTIIDQRANAVANNTLYPIIVSNDNVDIVIKGIIKSTTILGNMFELSGNNIVLLGEGGKLQGPGGADDVGFLDTNTADTALQWHPCLLKVDGNNCRVSNLSFEDYPTHGINCYGTALIVDSCLFIGGRVNHSTTGGTVLMGIRTNVGADSAIIKNNRFIANSIGGKCYSCVFPSGNNFIISDNICEKYHEHAVYAYGDYGSIFNNKFTDVDCIASDIQYFATYGNIKGNYSIGTEGFIQIMHGKGTIVEGNIATGCRGGIIVRPYHTVDVTKLPSGLKIVNNFIELSIGTTGSCLSFYVVGTYDISDILIAGNTFSNGYYTQTSRVAASLLIGAGSSGNNGIKFLRVENNIVRSGRGAVSWLTGIHNSIFKNNKFISESLDGVTSAFSSAINANYVTDTIFEGNEFIDIKSTPTMARAIQLNTGTTNLTVADNNIINYTSNIYLDYDTDAKLIYKRNNRLNYIPLNSTTANRPAAYAQEQGFNYFDTDLKKPMWWSGVAWRDADGYPINTKVGTTAQRPSLASTFVGFEYFDTTLNAPIMWDGTKWINEDGTLTSKVVIV